MRIFLPDMRTLNILNCSVAKFTKDDPSRDVHQCHEPNVNVHIVHNAALFIPFLAFSDVLLDALIDAPWDTRLDAHAQT